MNFDLPPSLLSFLSSLDTFITGTILPIQNDPLNIKFFDHRREHSRTNWSSGGLPTPEWDALLSRARKLADEVGFYRFALPTVYGGKGHPDTNLWMCATRFHLASHPVYGGGLGLANDLQNEHSVVGNFPDVLMLEHFGSKDQRETLIPARLKGEFRATFGLTEPNHGSDATHMETSAKPITRDGVHGFLINGAKKWQSGAHHATHMLLFARTSSSPGSSKGITCFIVPITTPGVHIESYEWTFNMPTDHATISFENVFVPASSILGQLDSGLAVAQTFVHENRIRQASSSCGAAKFCIDKAVEYARNRKIWGGKALSENQAIQWPLVELATQVEMLRLLILRTACEMDVIAQEALRSKSSIPPWVTIEKTISYKIAMCNYYANRLVCQAADRAIQTCGGNGYSRHMPFEHVYRHFRRYRITEGSEEVQMRKVAGWLFGLKGARKGKGEEKEEGRGKL
jgi:alkylation response protein AidB-like acyl-CoA dehydrogenase